MFNLPWFEVRRDDHPDERAWRRAQGWDVEDAAEAFVATHNTEAGIYPDDGDCVAVVVRDQAGVEHRVRVYASREIIYHGVKVPKGDGE